MNYLVHLYLAGSNPGHQLGSLMGDFVKGPLNGTFPAAVLAGIRQHRSIDSFSQTNSHCRRSRLRIDPRFGHVRGIMVDIFYDHFLADSWGQYHEQPLPEYAASVYKLLHDNLSDLPSGLAQIVPGMTSRNWLVSYADQESVDRALHHLARRLSRPTALAEGLEELIRHEVELRQDYRQFMAEAKAYASLLIHPEQN